MYLSTNSLIFLFSGSPSIEVIIYFNLVDNSGVLVFDNLLSPSNSLLMLFSSLWVRSLNVIDVWVDGNVNDNPPIVTPIDRIDDYTIRSSLIGGIPAFATPVPVGATIIHTANSSVYGDNLRDKYATVMLLNNSAEEAELYSINLEVSPSKLDPSS